MKVFKIIDEILKFVFSENTIFWFLLFISMYIIYKIFY